MKRGVPSDAVTINLVLAQDKAPWEYGCLNSVLKSVRHNVLLALLKEGLAISDNVLAQADMKEIQLGSEAGKGIINAKLTFHATVPDERDLYDYFTTGPGSTNKRRGLRVLLVKGLMAKHGLVPRPATGSPNQQQEPVRVPKAKVSVNPAPHAPTPAMPRVVTSAPVTEPAIAQSQDHGIGLQTVADEDGLGELFNAVHVVG